jgi:hypothetical protein
MEGPLHISLSDRLRVAGRAVRGLFKSPTAQDILGVYAGLFPGGPDRRPREVFQPPGIHGLDEL